MWVDMKEKMKKMSKKKIIAIIVSVAVLVSAIGGVVIYQSANRGEAMATLDMAALYQDEIVELSDIIVGTSETGTASLVYQEIELDEAYEVTEIFAASGVYVEEGDILATIDLENSNLGNSDEQQDLDDAITSLAQLEIEVDSNKAMAKATYDKSVASGESAETIYNLEIEDIDDTLDGYYEDIADLEDEIEELESLLKNGLTSDYGISDANSDIVEAEANIASTEELIAAETDATVLAELQKTLETYEQAKTSAESALSTATDQYDDAYEQTEEQLEQSENELTALEKNSASYAASVNTLKLNAKSTYDTTMFTYSNAYALYTLTIQELDEQLEEAEELIEELTEELENGGNSEAVVIDVDGNLLAPCSGYVTTVTEPSSVTMDGNTMNTGLYITVSDGAYAQIDVSIAQDDIADISIGMAANVVFDSYEDVLIESEVDSLSLTPSGDMTSSVNYTVTIICDIPEGEDMTIFSSMTATVTFVEAQAIDVLAISTNYVVYEDGQQYAYRELEDGTVEKVELVTGFSDGFDVEIISGLELGDIVLNESAVTDIEN